MCDDLYHRPECTPRAVTRDALHHTKSAISGPAHRRGPRPAEEKLLGAVCSTGFCEFQVEREITVSCSSQRGLRRGCQEVSEDQSLKSWQEEDRYFPGMVGACDRDGGTGLWS